MSMRMYIRYTYLSPNSGREGPCAVCGRYVPLHSGFLYLDWAIDGIRWRYKTEVVVVCRSCGGFGKDISHIMVPCLYNRLVYRIFGYPVRLTWDCPTLLTTDAGNAPTVPSGILFWFQDSTFPIESLDGTLIVLDQDRRETHVSVQEALDFLVRNRGESWEYPPLP